MILDFCTSVVLQAEACVICARPNCDPDFLMNRDDFILGALASSPSATYSPVQVQKLLFLLDRKIPAHVGGPHFHFEPYHYGPFDKTIYRYLEVLEGKGAVEILRDDDLRRRRYRLTAKGQSQGEQVLQALPDQIRDYVKEVAKFVRKASFAELVSAVYRAYPEMKANSIFAAA